MGEQAPAKSGFPKVKITGGPHAMNTKLTVDGQELAKVARVEIVADVHDAIRIKTFQFAEIEIEVEAKHEPQTISHTATVNRVILVDDPDEPGAKIRTHERIAIGSGRTEAAALYNAALVMDALVTVDPTPQTLTQRLSKIIRRRSGGNIVPW